MQTDYDVIVLGAGPAGAATGNLLARQGFSVLMLDRDRHPKHHIGESLLPASMTILEKLGVSKTTLAERYQPKFGARFFDHRTGELATFGFEKRPGETLSPTFQVFRETFDELLVERAAEAGCTVWQETGVGAVDEGTGTVRLSDRRTLRAKFLVDATGRGALLATKRRTKKTVESLGRLAIYNYFTNLPPHDDRDADYITMYVFRTQTGGNGWFWFIPLRDGRTSVGVVLSRAAIVPRLNPEVQFKAAVERIPRLAGRLAAATATDPYRPTADYSYTVSEKCGPGFILVGDAAGFLDPIFSSGVHLGLVSAQRAAGAITRVLRQNDQAALADYQTYMDRGFAVFRAFIDRFYQRDLVGNLFFSRNKPAEIHRAIVSILAGHVWDAQNPVLKLISSGDGAAAVASREAQPA